jgi:hypothetical protein
LLAAAGFTGCALLPNSPAKRRAAAQKEQTEAGKRPLLIGRITLVNAEEKFVLIDAAGTHAPAAETILRAYAGTELTGELRATKVQRRPFLIADITQGEPKRGDTVVRSGSLEPSEPLAVAVTAPTPTPAPKRRSLWLRLLPFRK